MSRFAQSANNFYSTISYSRPNTSNIKVERNRILSTGQTLIPKNSISSFRPQTGIAFRSSSSSFRNTKGKLQTLKQQLSFLEDDCKQTRTNTRELQLTLNLLKEQLNQRGIEPLKMDLIQQIKALEKAVKIRQRSDILKFEALHQTCHALNRNSKDIKGRLNSISDKLLEVENLLGYHGLRDKLKY